MEDSPVVRAVRGKKWVIFDLFHTLTALEITGDPSDRSTHEILGVRRQDWNDQLLLHSRDRLIGRKRDAFSIIRDLARSIDPSITDETIRIATDNRIARFATALVHLPDEHIRVVRALKTYGPRMGLLSNADVMEAAAWNHSPIAALFDSAIFSCEVGHAKPDQAIYRLSLQALQTDPADAIFVGDGGSRELEGARAVGLTTVMMTGIIKRLWPDRISERLPSADFVVENLSEFVPRQFAHRRAVVRSKPRRQPIRRVIQYVTFPTAAQCVV